MSLRIRFFAALVAVLACGGAQASAQATDALRLQVLSGKTGRPVTNTRVLLWRSAKFDSLDGTRNNPGATTDGEGYLSIPTSDAASFIVRVEFHIACAKDAQSFSFAELRAKGLVSPNTCSKRIKLYPQPGTLVLFVRDETFFERMRH